MEYRELIRIGRRRWWLIVLPLALSAVISLPELLRAGDGASPGFSARIRYSAAQQLDAPAGESDYTDIWLASEYTVDAFTNWVRSASFRDEIGRLLGEAPVALDSLQIAADNARSIGVIYLSHPDHDSLGAIAEAALTVLSSRSQSYFPQLGGSPAQVTILEEPALAAAPGALPSRLAPVLRLGVAFVIGIALAVLAEFIDPAIHHQDDLRRMGLPLLGSIPKERA